MTAQLAPERHQKDTKTAHRKMKISAKTQGKTDLRGTSGTSSLDNITTCNNATYHTYVVASRIFRHCATEAHGPADGDQPALFEAPAPASSPPPTPETGMPAWLVRALEEKTGGFRAARWIRCPHCHQLILEGLDDDICAFTVRADPTPITLEQEQLCATIGRPTYTVTTGTRLELDRRTWRHLGYPSPLAPIVPEHRCGARFQTFLKPPAHNTAGANNDRAPF